MFKYSLEIIDMGSAKTKIIQQDGCHIRVIHLERVEQARRESISEHELDRLSLTYKVLGDPNRLKIVMALRSVEMCVCDLAVFTGLSESAVSHQLRRLKDLALEETSRGADYILYPG